MTDLNNVFVDGDGLFVHPVWGGMCEDHLAVMPHNPLPDLTFQQVLDYIGRHDTHWDGHRIYVVHRIKVHHIFPSHIADKWFKAYEADYENLWDMLGWDDEISGMQYGFPNWRLGVQVFGRSGGWAGLTKSSYHYSLDRFIEHPYEIPDMTRGHYQYWYGDEEDVEATDRQWEEAAREFALDLLWFDVAVNGAIDNAIGVLEEMRIVTMEKVVAGLHREKMLVSTEEDLESYGDAGWVLVEEEEE